MQLLSITIDSISTGDTCFVLFCQILMEQKAKKASNQMVQGINLTSVSVILSFRTLLEKAMQEHKELTSFQDRRIKLWYSFSSSGFPTKGTVQDLMALLSSLTLS